MLLVFFSEQKKESTTNLHHHTPLLAHQQQFSSILPFFRHSLDKFIYIRIITHTISIAPECLTIYL